MPKRFFKKLAPNSDKIKKSKSLAWLGTALHHPWLWHFNRHSVAGAFAVGMFCMWIPFPPQTLIAASVAVLIRVNLPISVALVYVTNPITIPPLFYLAYQFGSWLLGENLQDIDFSFTTEWFKTTLTLIWQPMLLGCMIFAAISAVIGYYGIHLFWRLHIVQQIKDRRAKRRQKRKEELEAALKKSKDKKKK
ncbi:MAG: ATP-binding protein [uncultured Thiotrichaceae bacterium]|uniref:ATP-binding protein n=1 Tax=uncultured Thiotrichaceae bacterium TaxID=298394 RepID=A0A6S6SC41_9GAMM|nr:MAG: ATP-binding protein [uncultured Thiotrichaceae bacterium]